MTREELERERDVKRAVIKAARSELDLIEAELTAMNNRDGAVAKLAKAGLSAGELAALQSPSAPTAPAKGG